MVAKVTGGYRQGKTALFLIACGWAGAMPHFMAPGKGLFPALTLAFILGGYGLRTVISSDKTNKKLLSTSSSKENQIDNFPSVDVLVAARDEEQVIKRLVKQINSLNYPKDSLSLWVIDDGSKDKTAFILDQLIHQFDNLNVIKRDSNAGGGKSGALNFALSQTQGEWLLVLDADAQLQEDFLLRSISIAVSQKLSALQLRKAVINPTKSLLTLFQAMEMTMDTVIQEGRQFSGGVVELRGNGQLLRRDVIDRCGGFNEDTVTDDLDLSFRLLISGASAGILWDPPVQEEAVDTLSALWKQRQRWAEGGLQRFFDYFSFLISNNLSIKQRQDLLCFFLLQYALPVVSLYDLIIALFSKTYPLYWPLSLIALVISGLAFWKGSSRQKEGPNFLSPNLIKIIMAMIYLSHWFIVIPWVAIKMALFPKKLIWVKTSHKG